jgi:hypothetical protein
MKFCPVLPEICRGQVHGPRKERRKRIRRIRIIIIKIKIIIRNEAKTISLPNFKYSYNVLKFIFDMGANQDLISVLIRIKPDILKVRM